MKLGPWLWVTVGSSYPGFTISIFWWRRCTCWSPGSGRCSTRCWSLWPAWPYTPATSSCRSTSWPSCTTSRSSNDTMTPPTGFLSLASCPSVYPPAPSVCGLLGSSRGIVSAHVEAELLLLLSKATSKVKALNAMSDDDIMTASPPLVWMILGLWAASSCETGTLEGGALGLVSHVFIFWNQAHLTGFEDDVVVWSDGTAFFFLLYFIQTSKRCRLLFRGRKQQLCMSQIWILEQNRTSEWLFCWSCFFKERTSVIFNRFHHFEDTLTLLCSNDTHHNANVNACCYR